MLKRLSARREFRSGLVPLLVRIETARQRAPPKAAYNSHLASVGQQATLSSLHGARRKPAFRPSSGAHTQLAGSQRDKNSCLMRLYSLVSLWLSNLIFNLPSLYTAAATLGQNGSIKVEPVPVLDMLLSQYAYIVLTGVFFKSRESEAALLHALGASCNCLSLLQAPFCSKAGSYISWTVGCSLLVLLGICILKMQCSRKVGKTSVHLQCWCSGLWRAWEESSAVIGLALLAQAAGMAAGVKNLHPAFGGAAAGLLLHTLTVTGRLPSFLSAIWQEGGAWAATCCFMLQPAVHLFRIGSDASYAGRISYSSIVQMLWGYTLMLPRALYIKDAMWTIAMAWGTATNWAILGLLSTMQLPQMRTGILPPFCFIKTSVLLLLHLSVTFRSNQTSHQQDGLDVSAHPS